MEKKTVKIGEKEFVVRELLAKESDILIDMESEKTSDRIRERLKMQTDLSDEDYDLLTEKERDAILAAMNELNGWGK